MSTTKPQTLNFQFIFEMMIIFTLNTNEMRVIFVVLISTILALYPPNMSFLRELFSNLPSSGKYFKTDPAVLAPGRMIGFSTRLTAARDGGCTYKQVYMSLAVAISAHSGPLPVHERVDRSPRDAPRTHHTPSR